jgi:hypothetical protein
LPGRLQFEEHEQRDDEHHRGHKDDRGLAGQRDGAPA